jgi:hypothetical protein|nr:hypothetical protein [uncultured Lachnoanaerobaculum sp.]
MEEKKIKHLEFIQENIIRMGQNSFQIKGLMLTITAALLAVYAENHGKLFILVAIIPTVLFWGLDAYYLQQERKFRGIYDTVTEISDQHIDFKMSLHDYRGGQYSYFSSLFSKTLLPLYLITIFILILLLLLSK